MERQNATENARNTLNSRIGKALLDDSKFPGRLLELQKSHISNEQKHQQALMNNNERLFKHTRLIYNFEPTIVVERAGSPCKQPSTNSEDIEIPHYMSDLDKNKPFKIYQKPTIDAFKVRKKKKKNVWETRLTEKDFDQRFRSIVLKSPPLTHIEQYDLDKGWSLYRPLSRMELIQQQRLEQKKKEHQELAASNKSKSSSTFITDTASEASDQASLRRQRRSKMLNRLSESHNRKAAILLPQREPKTLEINFDHEKLKRFEEIRDKQLIEYHRYIK